MKKLFFILGLITLLFACSDDDDNTPERPIQNLKLPAEETTFLSGQSVTIEGKGFTTESQIWLRAAGTKATGDVQAKITAVNESSITFEVPEGLEGQHSVILKQNGEEYDLGKLTFKITESYKEKLYTYKVTTYNSKETKQIVEINFTTGQEKVIATLDIPSDYLEHLIYLSSSKKIAGLYNKAEATILVEIDILTGNTESFTLTEEVKVSYKELFKDENDDLYAYKTSNNDDPTLIKRQIVKLASEKKQEEVIINLTNHIRNLVFIPSTKDIIGNDKDNNLVKINIKDKKLQTYSRTSSDNYTGFVIDNKNNIFAAKANNLANQIVKINLIDGTEKSIISISDTKAALRDLVFITSTNEIGARIDSDRENTLLKINLDTKQVTRLDLDNNNEEYRYEYDCLIINQ